VKTMTVRVAVAGVGNCAAVFVQGLRFYAGKETRGLWHPTVAGLKARDVEVVSAFDIDARKVGLPVSRAIFAPPNVAKKYLDGVRSSVRVSAGISKGDVPPHLKNSAIMKSGRDEVSAQLKKSKVDILVNLISSGSDSSSEEYAMAALDAGCAFVNCTPSLLQKKSKLVATFSRKNLPLIGDDLMSQFGGTVFHKGLLGLMVRRGVRITKSYQLDVGGGSETLNTIDETIKMAKRTVKTGSVVTEVPYQFETVSGTTDFVDYMGNERTSYFWFEGFGFMNSGISVDVYLRSTDGTNAGNILLDVLRSAYRALKSGRMGTINEICAYGFKAPPKQMNFDEAYTKFAAAYVR
jgi:myo-inositol-1-phosphate synthase